MSASTTTAAATTTYPFTFTTYSNASPSPFTKPTNVPSIFSFGSALSCATNSASASALPLDRPVGLQPACVISNAAEVNDHAFWDLYECCKGKDMTAFGSPGTCTAQCKAEDGQTWQELGECLSKRVEIVVCKPDFSEIARNETSSASSGSVAPSASGGQASSSSSGGGGVQASGSTGAANTVGAGHATFSKAGVVMFGVLALGSAAGMFL